MCLALFIYTEDYNELPPGNWGVSYFMGGNVDYHLCKYYGIDAKLTICPSAAEYRDPNWYLWGSEHWTEGKMTYHYLGGNGGGNGEWPHTNGWPVGISTFYFRWPEAGFYPRKSLTESKFCNGNFDVMPLMLDIATYDDEIHYGFKPWRSNHVSDDGTGRAAGENVLFYDGHLEWQELVSGKSWQFGQDYYDPFWITSPAGPPDGDENYIVP